jgi:hypothetical protein
VSQPVRVLKIDRDQGGIVVTGDEAPAAKPEAAAPAPIKVRSRRAAEKLGWVFVLAEEAHVRAVPGTDYLEKVPGRFMAELTGSFRPGDLPMTHRQSASSLEALLHNIEDWENRRRAT